MSGFFARREQDCALGVGNRLIGVGRLFLGLRDLCYEHLVHQRHKVFMVDRLKIGEIMVGVITCRIHVRPRGLSILRVER